MKRRSYDSMGNCLGQGTNRRARQNNSADETSGAMRPILGDPLWKFSNMLQANPPSAYPGFEPADRDYFT